MQMEPLVPSSKLVGPYAEALHAYLKEPCELELRKAGELGRDAMRNGLGLSELSAIHHESVRQLLASKLRIDVPEDRGIDLNSSPCEDRCLGLKSLATQEIAPTLTAAGDFFAESMSAFEVNQREFQQSNTALRYLNSKLEQQVSQVSRVLFDEAMQLLAAVALALDRANRKLPAAQLGNLDEAQNLLERLGEQLSACTYDLLHPRVLQDLGLRAAIHALSRRVSVEAQIDVRADTLVGPVQPEVGMALYKAVHEALANVVRHARANHVRICVCSESDGVHCSVRDDGIGFDSSKLFSGAPEQGSGLICIWESLRSVGGTMAVNSSPGAGTEIAIKVGNQPGNKNG